MIPPVKSLPVHYLHSSYYSSSFEASSLNMQSKRMLSDLQLFSCKFKLCYIVSCNSATEIVVRNLVTVLFVIRSQYNCNSIKVV
jgi:hypothetical protein